MKLCILFEQVWSISLRSAIFVSFFFFSLFSIVYILYREIYFAIIFREKTVEKSHHRYSDPMCIFFIQEAHTVENHNNSL